MQYSHSAITEKALNILTTLATHSSFVDHERYTLNIIYFFKTESRINNILNIFHFKFHKSFISVTSNTNDSYDISDG